MLIRIYNSIFTGAAGYAGISCASATAVQGAAHGGGTCASVTTVEFSRWSHEPCVMCWEQHLKSGMTNDSEMC